MNDPLAWIDESMGERASRRLRRELVMAAGAIRAVSKWMAGDW